jgi:LacI family transcriptional regulator, galactose operon repressor
MSSLKEVAARAQVSTATVSHVINKTAYVSSTLRERVLKAMRQLNYHPNAVARSLKTNRSRTVGMIIPDIANPFFPLVVRGAEDALRHQGYTLILGNSDGDPDKEELYYNTFQSKRVDGILLIVAPSSSPPEYLRRHNHSATPIVYVDRFHSGLRGDVIMADNAGGSYQAVCHLVDTGHRRIGIITGPLELTNARLRLEGYERALREHQLPITDQLIRPGKFDVQSGYEQTTELLKLTERPTAVFVSNALMTLGFLRALNEAGVRCPQDVALVSFDDMEWFDFSQPRISAVAQPAYELGAKAAELLVKRIAGELSDQPSRKVLPTRLVIRESSLLTGEPFGQA